MNNQLLCLLLPLLAILPACLPARLAYIRNTGMLLVAISLLFLLSKLYLGHAYRNMSEFILAEPIRGLTLSLQLEPLGMLFSLVASSLWIATIVYSIAYLDSHKEKNQRRFFICFAIAISSTIGVAFSGNYFSLFLFYEILTISTYPLVTHSGSESAKKSGRVYLAWLLSTSMFLQLPVIIWLHVIGDSLTFQTGGLLPDNTSDDVIVIMYIIFLFGVGKAAIMPVHKWLPAAMVAPTPVSALLHAVAVVKAGVFTIVKVTVYVFGIERLAAIEVSAYLYLIPSFTVIMASVIALRQDNLKKRLAYSTISQLSYVVLATTLLLPVSITAAGLHIVAHAYAKITLFFAAGSIYTASGKTMVSQLNGIAARMPVTMFAFSIGSLAMIGLPPASGFISKWYMLESAISIQNWIMILVLMMSTLLNAAYFLPILYRAYFRKENVLLKTEHAEAPFFMVSTLILTAAVSITIFFLPDQIIGLLSGVGDL